MQGSGRFCRVSLKEQKVETTTAGSLFTILACCLLAGAVTAFTLEDVTIATEPMQLFSVGKSSLLLDVVCFCVTGLGASVCFGYVLSKLHRKPFTDGLQRAGSVVIATFFLFALAVFVVRAYDRFLNPSGNSLSSLDPLVPFVTAAWFIVGGAAARGQIEAAARVQQTLRRRVAQGIGYLTFCAPLLLLLTADHSYRWLVKVWPSVLTSQFQSRFNERPSFLATGGSCTLGPNTMPELRCILVAALLTRRDVILARDGYAVSFGGSGMRVLLEEPPTRRLTEGTANADTAKTTVSLDLPGERTSPFTRLRENEEFVIELRIGPGACWKLSSGALELTVNGDRSYLHAEAQLLHGRAGAGLLVEGREGKSEARPYASVIQGEPDDSVDLGTWAIPARLVQDFVARCESQRSKTDGTTASPVSGR